jgi:hypothetical protein
MTHVCVYFFVGEMENALKINNVYNIGIENSMIYFFYMYHTYLILIINIRY